MNNELYEMIYKRKSFHLFREKSGESLTEDELNDIVSVFKKADRLDFEIKVDLQILKTSEVNCKRDAEYCLLLFSEKKDGYLQNIGYIGEQLDLYLASKNIGSLWFGIAKHKEQYNGLDYVIMLAIAKVDESKFRKDMFKSKRKSVDEIWKGNDLGIANIVRFAPSACNSQPWYVENNNNVLYVYRQSKSGKVGIMPKNAANYYNQIDIGIFMYFLKLCLQKQGIAYKRTLCKDNGSFDNKELNAVYELL